MFGRNKTAEAGNDAVEWVKVAKQFALQAIAEARSEAVASIHSEYVAGAAVSARDRRQELARTLVHYLDPRNETELSRLHAWVEDGKWPSSEAPAEGNHSP